MSSPHPFRVYLIITVVAVWSGQDWRSVTAYQSRALQLAPYSPTPQDVVDRMLALANVTSKDVVYDLGSGDGRIVISAARAYGARGVGFDIEPTLVNLARANAKRAAVEDRVQFALADVMTADVHEATVVTLYYYHQVPQPFGHT